MLPPPVGHLSLCSLLQSLYSYLVQTQNTFYTTPDAVKTSLPQDWYEYLDSADRVDTHTHHEGLYRQSIHEK